MSYGGETGIRTLDTLSSIHAFQACAFSHSAISPWGKRLAEAPVCGPSTHNSRVSDHANAMQLYCSVLADGVERSRKARSRAVLLRSRATTCRPSVVGPGSSQFPFRRWHATALRASQCGAL